MRLTSAGHPFLVLLRSRRAYFRRQSFALYLRYAHVAAVLLALFGVALAERPALLAEPILHFWRAPGSLIADAGWAGAWLACVFAWVRIHRGFIAGGALAAYARSLPLVPRVAALVDAAMLLLGLQLFLVPAGLAAWTVATDSAAGAPWFALRALLLGALSLGVAAAAARGVTVRAAATLGLSWAALAAAGQAGMLAPSVLALAFIGVGVDTARRLAAAPGPATRASVPGRSGLRLHGVGFLLSWQLSVIVRRHLHAALPRLGLAAGVLLACLWMIFCVGKLAESSAFLKVGCWLTAAIMSGFYYLFWRTRQPQQAWLRSLSFGPLRMALAEQACVLGATALLYAGAWTACLLQVEQGALVAAQLARHAAGSLATLALLGAPIIQRHQDGILIKVALLVLTFLLL